MSAAWARDQRTLKLRVGSIARWKKLAVHLELPADKVIATMLELHLELTLKRSVWLSAAELAKRLRPGAAAYMQALKLAENRNGQVVLLDVERTVNESLMRRNQGLRKLPAVRARGLLERMVELFEKSADAGALEHRDDDQAVLELLRARAAGDDVEILRRWERAICFNDRPRSLAAFNRSWNRWA